MNPVSANQINWAVMNSVIDAALASVAAQKLETDKHSRWLNAIRKAREALHDNPFISLRGDGALIWMSEQTDETYTVTNACECKAAQLGMPCKHLAGKRLLENYAKAIALPQVLMMQPRVILEDAQPHDSMMAAYKSATLVHKTQVGEKYGRMDV